MKVGLDDFFAAGGTVDGLLELASHELRPAPEPKDRPNLDEPYFVEHGSTYWRKDTKEGPISVLLANFSATIVEDVVEDDGAEQRRLYGIRAHVDGQVHDITVPAERFSMMNWAAEQLGPTAIVTAGIGSRDRLREAIQALSPKPITRRVVHRHLGWIRIEGKWAYLHAGGAIGADGPLTGVEVHLDPPLDRYVLPAPPTGDALREAVRATFGLLRDVASDRVMFPLFSFLWTTIIRPLLESLHLTGKTGVKKTELMALAQRHHGAGMHAQNLPGSWSSTANSNEVLAFLAADSLFTIDDYCPTGSATDVQRLNRDGDRVFRGRGNGSGRGRLRSDGTPRPLKPFRAGIGSTGEDTPHGHSVRARLIIVKVGEGEVNLERLTDCQEAGALYSHTTAAFVQWLAGRRTEVLAWFETEVPRQRDALLVRAPHGRTATACAQLSLGLRAFLLFSRDCGALSEEEMRLLDQRGQKALLEVLASQAEHQAASDPAHLFVQLIGATLMAGDAHLADRKSGGRPQSEDLARAVGWQSSESGAGQAAGDWRARGSLIGWIDVAEDSIFLNPSSAHKAAARQADSSPNRIGLGERALWDRLSEAGLLVSEDPDRHTKKTRIVGRLQGVLHFRISDVLGESGTTGTASPGASDGPEKGNHLPDPVPDPSWPASGTGPEIGNTPSGASEPAVGVPDVPDVPDPQANERGPMFDLPPGVCWLCRKSRFWHRKPSGPVTCGTCHPPSIESDLVVWIDDQAEVGSRG